MTAKAQIIKVLSQSEVVNWIADAIKGRKQMYHSKYWAVITLFHVTKINVSKNNAAYNGFDGLLRVRFHGKLSEYAT